MCSLISLNGFTCVFKKFHGMDATCFASPHMKLEKAKSKAPADFSECCCCPIFRLTLSLSLYFCLLSGSVCRIVVVAHYLRLSDCWRFQADAVLWHLTLAVNDLSAWHLSSGTCSPHSTPHLPPHSPSPSLCLSFSHCASFSR